MISARGLSVVVIGILLILGLMSVGVYGLYSHLPAAGLAFFGAMIIGVFVAMYLAVTEKDN